MTLLTKEYGEATKAKLAIEQKQKQRDEADERKRRLSESLLPLFLVFCFVLFRFFPPFFGPLTDRYVMQVYTAVL
jgi:hypothetical protein